MVWYQVSGLSCQLSVVSCQVSGFKVLKFQSFEFQSFGFPEFRNPFFDGCELPDGSQLELRNFQDDGREVVMETGSSEECSQACQQEIQ